MTNLDDLFDKHSTHKPPEVVKKPPDLTSFLIRKDESGAPQSFHFQFVIQRSLSLSRLELHSGRVGDKEILNVQVRSSDVSELGVLCEHLCGYIAEIYGAYPELNPRRQHTLHKKTNPNSFHIPNKKKRRP